MGGPHLAGIHHSLTAVQAQSSSAAGMVRISVSHALGRAMLLPALMSMPSQYPNITLEVFMADGIDNMLHEQLDIALRLGPLPDSNLIARRLGDLSVCLVGAPSLLKQHKPPKTIVSLAALPAIGFRVGGSGQFYSWAFKRGD